MNLLAAGISILLLMVGCSQPPSQPSDPSPVETGNEHSNGLSVEIEVGDAATSQVDEPVDLLLVVTAFHPVTLQFSSGQRFDFVVSKDGEEVWRWSGDQFFTQALGEESLSAGDELRYQAQWTPTEEGTYEVLGLVTATNPEFEEGSLSAEQTLTVEGRS
ncbi:MAG: hypothetical protein KY429_08290 [Actinobacteria bacterium]|nr:hypothetical protein [Actinomycetota bacterium]